MAMIMTHRHTHTYTNQESLTFRVKTKTYFLDSKSERMYSYWLENEGSHVSRNAGSLWKPRSAQAGGNKETGTLVFLQ